MDERRRSRLTADLARLADGDRAAFDPVFEAAWPIVQGFSKKALASEADAEDCAQHVLLRVFSRASEFDRTRDALAWILTIASFEIRTIRKKRTRRREDFGAEDGRVDEGFEAAAMMRELEAALGELLCDLDPKDREAILASIGEIDRPPVPAPTFRKRLQRAMTRLKDAWRIRHGTE